MKKFIVFMTSIITMMIIVASPIMSLRTNAAVTLFEGSEIEAEYAECPHTDDKFTSVQSFFNYNSITNENTYYYYLKYGGSDAKSIFVYFTSADITFDNNVLIISNPIYESRSAEISYAVYYSNGNRNTYNNSISYFEIDYTNHTCRYKFSSSGGYSDQYGISNANWYYSETNYSDIIKPHGLNLNVSFTYPMSGEMTRKKTGETGITTTTDGNLMYVNNLGANAQFCMAIVPKGESLSFNTWAYSGRDNIIGNPTFVYICDEWQSFGVLSAINIFDSSASANSIYAPSAWHTVEEGASRTYYLAWESMKLEKNKEYDCVVYGCLNEDMEEMSGFYYDNYNLGSTYTVSSTINDVQEVYRSTFTMKDPATFNPNYKNEHDSSHPWDPDSDNADLFSTGSAYKDENGNVVIKGFKKGSSGLSWENGSTIGGSSSGSNNLNVNNAFGGFFGFFKGILGFLPKEYTVLIFFGLVGLVAIGIIKAVK